MVLFQGNEVWLGYGAWIGSKSFHGVKKGIIVSKRTPEAKHILSLGVWLYLVPIPDVRFEGNKTAALWSDPKDALVVGEIFEIVDEMVHSRIEKPFDRPAEIS